MIRARLCTASGRSPFTRAAVAGEGVAEAVAAEARPELAVVAEEGAVAVAKPTAAAEGRAGAGAAVRASPCWSPAPR